METVKFKRNWIWKIERFFYSHVEEAEDTCTLRWRLIKIILSIPFSFMTWVYVRLMSKDTAYVENTGKTGLVLKMITLFFAFVILGVVVTESGGEEVAINNQILLLLCIGMFLFSTLLISIPAVTIIYLVAGIGELISLIPKPKAKRSRDIEKIDSIFSTLYKSLKEKYCNRIEWINKNNNYGNK